MIEKNINRIIQELKEDSVIHKAEQHDNKIPTLKEGVYKNMSPMLKKRFELLGGWEDSTHGDWLSISEMKYFWDKGKGIDIQDERIIGIVENVCSALENWENDIAGIIPASNISVFAGSAYTSERIYLVWKEDVEPELWVYDVNGESQFKNTNEYLVSYLNEE